MYRIHFGIKDLYQFALHVWPGKPKYTEHDYPDLSGRVYIVTGAAGIGYEATRLLLGQGAKVYLAVRSDARGQECVRRLLAEFKDAAVDYFVIDLAEPATIGPGVAKFLRQETVLHGVLQNAGVMCPPRGAKTSSGLELQLGTNNVGSHVLQTYLDPILLRTAAKEPRGTVRVVWVTSSVHMFTDVRGGINWDDLAYERAAWAPLAVLYCQSKAMNIYQAHMWAKKHDADDAGVISLAVHPGNLRTSLDRHITSVYSFGFHNLCFHPPKHGAYTELYALLSPTLTPERNNGSYIVPWGATGRIRPDIEEGMKGANGERVWSWLEEQAAPYLASK
ncbi:uncharacterized protein V1510DRAFT_364815 [Dipodascopsis tothii]|uniref:uncharacterized protein n=1 Tax=Dipodascopsis tothii TaxID=44089 RepID=UPI0034CFB0F0